MPETVTVDTVETYETDHYGRVYVITQTLTADGIVIGTHRRPIEPDAPIEDESEAVKDIVHTARTREALARFAQLTAEDAEA